LPRGGIFTPPKTEIFRPVLGLLSTQFFVGSIMRVEPLHDPRPETSSRQRINFRKTFAFPHLQNGFEPVPAESRANAPVELAIVHEESASIVSVAFSGHGSI
jgi:hypothetical protein